MTPSVYNVNAGLGFSAAQLEGVETFAQAASVAPADAEARVAVLEQEAARKCDVALPCIIISRGGMGSAHKVTTDYTLEPPQPWKSHCGCKYGLEIFIRKSSLVGFSDGSYLSAVLEALYCR